MSYETERQAITQAWKTAWAAGSDLPVQYRNIKFDPPADGGPYVAFAILRGQSVTAGMVGGGENRYRHPGVLQIDINISEGKGSRIALELADEVAAIFRGQVISGIVFRAPALAEISEPEVSRTRHIISIPFHRDTNY